MAAIFPPADEGGVPPGPNIINGFTPTHRVIGQGPFYVSPDCTTVLTDGQLNAITSEILAAVDELGFPYNTTFVDNLGQALSETVDRLKRDIDTRVRRAGDAMTGPLMLSRDPEEPTEGATKRYVDNQDAELNTTLREHVDDIAAAITASYRAADALLDERKINRAGDTMTGPLLLYGEPEDAMEAVSKEYMEQYVAAHAGGIDEPPYGGLVYGRTGEGAWQPVLPIQGGTLTGPLILSSSEPEAPDEAASKLYVDSQVAAGGTFVDAPFNDLTYGRLNASWTQVLPITGGTVNGEVRVNGHFYAYWGVLHLNQAGDRYLQWDGENYNLGGAGVIWHTGNFNPDTKLTTDGRITSVHFDGGSHMQFVIDGWWIQSLANYSDLANFVSDARAYDIARYIVTNENPAIAHANNFANSFRWVHAGDAGGSNQGGGAVGEPFPGAVITSVSNTINARFRYLQFHIPNVGWQTAGVG